MPTTPSTLRRTIARLCVLLLVIACLSPRAGAQDAATRLRLAQNHEQAGNFEQALRLYGDLHRKEPGNVVFFEGLKRSYLQLKRYTEAAALIRSRLTGGKADIPLMAQLGGVHYKAGEDSLAAYVWDRAVALDPAAAGTYRVVASVLMENRLLDRAAELYRSARTACNDPNLFTQELAQLLGLSMDYAGATAEYIRLLRTAPAQLGFVQGRMASFTGKPDARDAAIGVVRAELRRGDDLTLYRLLGWLELEGRAFDTGRETYRTIDRLARAQGGELYTFAERALREKAYEAAARAYQDAIETPLQAGRLPFARYGYASAVKELSTMADSAMPLVIPSPLPPTGSSDRFDRAIRLFRSIIVDYPRSEFSARSYYQIGLLQFERLFDLDGALASFEAVGRELPALAILRYDVSLRTGQVLLARGDTTEAAVRFARVAGATDATPDQQDEATFRLAELSFFGGSFPRALELLNGLSLNLKADYANDALALSSFLQQNAGQDEALRIYAAAELAARRRQTGDAITRLEVLIRDHARAPVAADGLLRMAGLQAQERRYRESLASYEALLAGFAESSIALDRARFGIAEIHQYALGDTPRAIAAYEQVLTDYPRSLLTTIARRRIRELRGDTL